MGSLSKMTTEITSQKCVFLQLGLLIQKVELSHDGVGMDHLIPLLQPCGSSYNGFVMVGMIFKHVFMLSVFNPLFHVSALVAFPRRPQGSQGMLGGLCLEDA